MEGLERQWRAMWALQILILRQTQLMVPSTLPEAWDGGTDGAAIRLGINRTTWTMPAAQSPTRVSHSGSSSSK